MLSTSISLLFLIVQKAQKALKCLLGNAQECSLFTIKKRQENSELVSLLLETFLLEIAIHFLNSKTTLKFLHHI